MEATQGSPRHATHAGDEKPPQWRWLAMALAVAVHGPIVLLLSSGRGGEDTTPREPLERMRISWSERPRPRAAIPPIKAEAAPGPSPAAAVATTGQTAIAAPEPSRVPALSLDLPEGWLMRQPGGNGGDDNFRRDLFAHGDADPFVPPSHLPRLRMQDSSLGGRLQEAARRKACGELRGALKAQPESTEAIFASMKRWKCGM